MRDLQAILKRPVIIDEHFCLGGGGLLVPMTWLSFFLVFRKQYSVYRGTWQAESPATHSKPGWLWLSGGSRWRGGPQVWWTAALLQHPFPALYRPSWGRGLRPQWQVRPFALLCDFFLLRSDDATTLCPQTRRNPLAVSMRAWLGLHSESLVINSSGLSVPSGEKWVARREHSSIYSEV